MCGNESTNEGYWTIEQLDFAERHASDYLKGIIHNAIKDDAKSFNIRQPKVGFITMSMTVIGQVPMSLILPIPSKDICEQKIHYFLL